MYLKLFNINFHKYLLTQLENEYFHTGRAPPWPSGYDA